MPTMPNVVGMEYPAALLAMVTAGVRVLPFQYFQVDPVTISWVSSSSPSQVVLGQSPSSGQSVAVNSAVSLTVSALPISVAYPGSNMNVDI